MTDGENMRAHFGPAGNPDAFYQAGYKASVDMPAWLAGIGLTAYEYQCSRGANVREETARAIGRKVAEHGIKVSIHAPYYINLATLDSTITNNTQQHFLKSLEVARWIGADRIIFHAGGPGKQERQAAMDTARRSFAAILDKIAERGLSDLQLAVETMGKQNQLGTLQEVLSLCRMAEQVVPAVDFGHLHAVTGGGYLQKEEYANVFDTIGEALGQEAAANLHIHFSRIEFTKAGEKRHWTFADPFGPPHEPLLELCAERGYTPRIICESAGTQAIDAKTMQDFYVACLAGNP